MRQTPEPGQFIISYQGDCLTVTLRLDTPHSGNAFLRTNIGHARTRQDEVIEHVESGRAVHAADWDDLPMASTDQKTWTIDCPLDEIGAFEAKAFFLPATSHEPVWPAGGNLVVKVEPATSCCANTIYTAFVRQFRTVADDPATTKTIKELDAAGYVVIPKSGTFRDLIARLDVILCEMRFRVIQLLPIHPTPTTYARMGRFGSPFASLDFFDVDPALAEFDRKTTPLDQFLELVDEVHARQARVFIDLPINHTGWASHLQIHHPEWFGRNPDATFESPGAWGVTWEDLSELDYDRKALWRYMADVFLFWCRHGVDGFRCDAGYMIPLPVWEYIVAKVRREFPNTVFLLEGLGGKISVMQKLLTSANLNWAYSELFQQHGRPQIEAYLADCNRISAESGTLAHYAETHDNDRLAASSREHALMRTALAALTSHTGAFGITNGVEWFAQEKVDVHEAHSINWGAKENQVEQIQRLNAILDTHPCFGPGVTISNANAGGDDTLVLLRSAPTGERLLVLANLNTTAAQTATWNDTLFPASRDSLVDLRTGKKIGLVEQDNGNHCRLSPGEVLCVDSQPTHLTTIEGAVLNPAPAEPERSRRQRLKAHALTLHRYFTETADASDTPNMQAYQDITWSDEQLDELAHAPGNVIERITGTATVPVTCWQWPADGHRTVMRPSSHLLLVEAPHSFRVQITCDNVTYGCQDSISGSENRHWALFAPAKDGPTRAEYTLSICMFSPDGPQRITSPILQVHHTHGRQVPLCASGAALLDSNQYALCTNHKGGMTQVRFNWGHIRSRYDALLAVNLHPEHPVDRHIMLTRIRGWVVNKGYSHAIAGDCLRAFSRLDNGSLLWHFHVPVGLGKTVKLNIELSLCTQKNVVFLRVVRLPGDHPATDLDDDVPIRVVLRPDIEDRNCHETTKAHTGVEDRWPHAVTASADGFRFAPHPERTLRVTLPGSSYVEEPEWTHMVFHPFEHQRGLDPHSDLYSPGYFRFRLAGNDNAMLSAGVNGEETAARIPALISTTHAGVPRPSASLRDVLNGSMRAFIVQRDGSRTVIAGYPWFLDWGRDTLICLRGIIAAGMLEESRDILYQFARFEENGTLPNMIRGDDHRDRDTSDAPLWFFTACRDLVRSEGCNDFLETDCGNRTIRDVLLSIAEGYMHGTPNGIRMDAETGLIFSPSHFTWMDTNYPAGTPREGYPIEIQSLWVAALTFLSEIDPDGAWRQRVTQVRQSIVQLFRRPNITYLSDCLHAHAGQSPAQASPDDALRSNQLLAITLGAIDDPALISGILRSCEKLLVPGAIRSLADQPVSPPLAVHSADGDLLNDPDHPYQGVYGGDEDAKRKPAYHNGTAWTWPFPSYCEALALTGAPGARRAALDLLSSSENLVRQGCLGHIPEILDGDTPHKQRGCGAQAWGETELYRVLLLLED